MVKVRTQDLIKRFDLELVAGVDGVHHEIVTSDISRPGMEMAGYFTHYPKERLQLMGRTELSFLYDLTEEEVKDRMTNLCTDVTPGIVITRGMEVPPSLIEAANEAGVPVMRSPYKTTRVISRLTTFLESKFAPTTAVHGVLVDVYGIGVLITGASGIGKSETALELVKRGHRLVADDNVEIKQEDYDTLIGNPPNLIEYLLEIRGLGIINVMTLFGAGAVRNFKRISLVAHLETWEADKQYDRLGLDEDTMKIMDVNLPKAIIPVRPGRNLSVIIEVAAMNFRLKKMGINTAEEFSERLNKVMDVNQDDVD
ncbi:HPr(Ser) kinase/phosphatase [Halalkalibacillus halophilus]|uniref:HPr(Ser) kinase/phosphatase n=1 Tax=Halalkalibacillus halophilus TaxID=392827 RepID=UPI0004262452|nr:HPr(Ser) kinase/phosphatase [Halalkalibacillus halophilus]